MPPRRSCCIRSSGARARARSAAATAFAGVPYAYQILARLNRQPVIPPLPGYLEGVRALCTEKGAVMIMDEVKLLARHDVTDVARGPELSLHALRALPCSM